MSALRRGFARYLILFWFIGWISYPGWFNEWYSNLPERYAYPASLSSPNDPPWGFWFW
jgi:hypothetical protein